MNECSSLAETKAIIKSLIIPYQDGVFLKTLNKDYYELEGKTIPFRELGFNDLKSFLNSMPDVVRMVIRGPSEWDITLFPVADESTAHIVKLVSGQMNRGKKRNHFSRSLSSYKPYQFSNTNYNMNYVLLNCNSIYNNHINQTRYNRLEQPIYSIPRQSSFHNGPHINHNHINHNDRYKIGYPIVNTSNLSSSSPSLLGIPVTFSNQNSSTSLNGFNSNNNNTTSTNTLSPHKSVPITRTIQNNTTNNNPIKEKVTQAISALNSLTIEDNHNDYINGNNSNDDNLSSKDSNDSETKTKLDVNELVSFLDIESETKEEIDKHKEGFGPFNKVAVNNIRRVLSKFSHGLPVSLFAQEYQKETSHQFNSRDWGFTTQIELYYYLNNKIISIQEPNYLNDDIFPGYSHEPFIHDIRVKHFKNQPKNHLDFINSGFTYKVPDHLLGKIMKLIDASMPNGMDIEGFDAEFIANYKEELNYESFRFRDLEHLFFVLSQELPIRIEKVEKQYRIYIKDYKSLRQWLTKCAKNGQYAIVLSMLDVPSDIVYPGESYKPISLPPNVAVPSKEWAAVLICTVLHPKCFWCQLQGELFYDALDQLMDQLEFYNLPAANDYSMTYSMVSIGLPVACLFPGDNSWHRAKITKILDQNQVQVMFVDYGGTLISDIKKLKFLRRNFFNLPAQAIRCSLFGVKPLKKNGKWGVPIRHRLLDFSRKELWLACQFLRQKDDHDNSFDVLLCDTSVPDIDVYIHELLIKEGLARREIEQNKDENHDKILYALNSTLNNHDDSLTSDDKSCEESCAHAESNNLNFNYNNVTILTDEEVPLDQEISINKYLVSLDDQSRSDNETESESDKINSLNDMNIDDLQVMARSDCQVVNSRINFGFLEVIKNKEINEKESQTNEESILTPIKLDETINLDLIKKSKVKQLIIDNVEELSCIKIVHIIYYQEYFWVMKKDFDDLLSSNTLWLIFSRGEGYISGCHEMPKNQAEKLCHFLKLQSYYDSKVPFILYRFETALKFCKVFHQQIMCYLVNGLKKFQMDIINDEKHKIHEMERSFENLYNSIDRQYFH